MEHHVYAKGAEITKEDQAGKYFFVVIKGTLDIFTNGHRGRKPLGCGDSFGDKALVNGSPRTATIVCQTAAELWAIARQTFTKVMTQLN
jgi:CRP-like cAMP-binding protein